MKPNRIYDSTQKRRYHFTTDEWEEWDEIMHKNKPKEKSKRYKIGGPCRTKK